MMHLQLVAAINWPMVIDIIKSARQLLLHPKHYQVLLLTTFQTFSRKILRIISVLILVISMMSLFQ